MSFDELKKVRLEKLELLKKSGMDPYPADSHRTHAIEQILDNFDSYASSGDHVVINGRVMARREHGGSMFVDLEDGSGRMQVYVKKDEIGDEMFSLFAEVVDIGDFIEIKGTLFITKKEEKSIKANSWRMLAKSLLPLPEKWHGLQDVEERYRRRYLDLLINPEVREKFRVRALIMRTIREVLNEHHFLEVVTPTLQQLYGGASARPFKTHIHAYDLDLFLRIAPELYLKRLLVGGYERVFEFTTNFRNEGVDREHNPEFSAVEWYAAYQQYEWNMEIVEEMLAKIAMAIFGSTEFRYKETAIDFKGPFRRVSFSDLMSDMLHIDITDDEEVLRERARELGINVDKAPTKEQVIDEIFKKEIRPKLIEPTFVHDYPKSMFPLAKIKPASKSGGPGTELAEVFQFYAAGFELVKAFTELNDPIDQRARFKGQEDMRAKGDDEAQQMDEDYVEAMEYGMPPNSGVGIGLDRLTALLTNSHSIREVILFPMMKPKDAPVAEGKSRDTDIAVAVVHSGLGLERWQEMNTIAHLNAAFGARLGRSLFYQDIIRTKDGKEIKLNIQHAIMIKIAESDTDIRELISMAQNDELEIAEFTREMLETTDDRKVIKETAEKKYDDIEYLGALVYGKKSRVEKITKNLKLFS